MARAHTLCVLAVMVTVSLSGAGQAAARSELAAAVRLYELAEYAAAVPRFENALAAGLEAADRARAREMLAVCHFVLGETSRAADSIRALLREQPSHQPGVGLPRPIREFFLEIGRDAQTRASLEAEIARLRAAASRPPVAGGLESDPSGRTPGSSWVLARAGTFEMGCAKTEDGCAPDEQPRHQVTVSTFRIMPTEVTVGMFRNFLAPARRPVPAQPGGSVRDDQPIVNVTWDDAVAFCESMGARLPTEAEWEYAARAGTTTAYWWGTAWDPASENGGGRGRTQPAGLAAHRNPWGLYDMLGNVSEWTSTVYRPYPYRSDDGREDPRSRARRVHRGGAYSSLFPRLFRSASRSAADPGRASDTVGFRCARSG